MSDETSEQRFFGIWINGTSVSAGYMSSDSNSPPTPRTANARRFATQDEAEREIARRGWLDDTGVRPGATTAYVVELIPTILVRRAS